MPNPIPVPYPDIGGVQARAERDRELHIDLAAMTNAPAYAAARDRGYRNLRQRAKMANFGFDPFSGSLVVAVDPVERSRTAAVLMRAWGDALRGLRPLLPPGRFVDRLAADAYEYRCEFGARYAGGEP